MYIAATPRRLFLTRTPTLIALLQVSVLKRMQGCPHVCKYLHCGHFEEHNYLVMELLGMNLSELRRRLTSPRQSFSPATTVRLVVQMIQSVAALHNVGFLHRDIKPSNFAVGAAPQRRQQCIMIDFGLARKYRLPNGQIRPARDVAGFRGTARCRAAAARPAPHAIVT